MMKDRMSNKYTKTTQLGTRELTPNTLNVLQPRLWNSDRHGARRVHLSVQVMEKLVQVVVYRLAVFEESRVRGEGDDNEIWRVAKIERVDVLLRRVKRVETVKC